MLLEVISISQTTTIYLRFDILKFYYFYVQTTKICFTQDWFMFEGKMKKCAPDWTVRIILYLYQN